VVRFQRGEVLAVAVRGQPVQGGRLVLSKALSGEKIYRERVGRCRGDLLASERDGKIGGKEIKESRVGIVG